MSRMIACSRSIEATALEFGGYATSAEVGSSPPLGSLEAKPRQCSAPGSVSNRLSMTYPKMTCYTALARRSLMAQRSHKALRGLPFSLHN